MKCPIKLSPAVAEFIKKNGLVYVGEGNPKKPLFKGKNIKSLSTDERETSPEEMHNNCGNWKKLYYFVSRADAKKHFPHCLPKTRKTPPKLRYFIPAKPFLDNLFAYGTHNGGKGNGKCYRHDGTVTDTLGPIEGVETVVRDWLWREVSKDEALARLTPAAPAKTEAETLREENAALKARVAEVESEKEKLCAAIKALIDILS